MSGIFGLFDENVNEGALTPEEVDSIMESEGCSDIESVKEFAGDLEDANMQAMLENETNYGILRESILTDEFKVYVESGEEIVYENDKLKSVWNKVKEFIKRGWDKVQAVFKKVVDTIKGWITSDKAMIEKHGTTISKAKSLKLKDAYEIDPAKITNGYDCINKSFGEIFGDFGKIQKANGAEGNVTEKAAGKFVETVVKACGGTGTALGDLATALTKASGMDDKKSEVVVSGKDVLEGLKTAKRDRKLIDVAYKTAKGSFAYMLKIANSLEKAMAASYDKKEQKSAQTVAIFSSGCRTAMAMTSVVNKVLVKAFNIEHSQMRRAASLAIAGVKKEGADDVEEGSLFV